MHIDSGRAQMRMDLVHGGRLASLKVDGRELLVTASDDPRGWGCYLMAPWAGRVRAGQFTWKEQPVQLPVNCGPHSIHGTVLQRQWSVEENSVVSSLLGPDWPWAGTVRSRLALSSDQLLWTVEVSALEEPFPVVVGWHPWFRRELSPGVVLQHDVQAKAMYVRDAAGIPTGAVSAPTAGPWDDCFRALVANPTLTWSDGFTVEVASTCDHWVVYDEPAHAVCIEPQSGPPDAFNLGGFDVASPGQPVVHSMTLRWR